MKKRMLAWIMTMCMVLSLLPVSALAVDDDSASGGKVNTTTATAQDDLVTFTKTVEKVAKNTFEITLKAVTKDTVTPVPAETSDIVLVIDESRSMDDDDRMDNAQTAATQFATTVLDEENEGRNRIAVASFGTEYEIKLGLTSELQAVIDAVSSLDADQGGTNIQGGIYAAREALSSSTADNKIIVLLSDGEPQNSYRAIGTGVWENCGPYHGELSGRLGDWSWTGFDYTRSVGIGSGYGNMTGGVWGTIIATCEHGKTRYFDLGSPYDNHGAPTIVEAGFAKDAGYEIYTVYLRDPDDDGSKAENAIYTLSNVATDPDHYLVPNDVADLANIFESIAGELITPTDPGTVVDPMGEYVQLVGSSLTDDQGVTIDQDGKGFTWDWSDATPVEDTENKTKTYTLTYQVTLDVEAADFASDTPYHTNGDTVLTYYVGGEENKLTIKEKNTPTVSSLAAYTVTYDANGGTGTVPTDSKSPYEDGSTVTVLDNTGDLDKDEAVFLGWSTTKSELVTTETAENALAILNAGDTFEIDGNTTLYAVWAEDTDDNGEPDYEEPVTTQVAVTYKIVGGTWSDGSTADKTVTLTLEEGSATLGNTIPTEMKPALGYLTEGAWDVEITGETTVSEDTTYTYSFDEDPVWHTEYGSIRVFLDDATQADLDRLSGISKEIRLYSDQYNE